MITFLNERSVGQFGDVSASLTFFFRASQELSSGGVGVWKDSAYFEGPWFRKQFNNTSLPRDSRAVLREFAFGSKYARCWRRERISAENDLYLCTDIGVETKDESLCEAAELKIRNGRSRIVLLSAAQSIFGQSTQLTIVNRRSTETGKLDNATSVDRVSEWIAADRGHYDPTSGTPPHDFQTILVKASDRFRRTNRRERRFGRLIYEEVETGRQYYVDHGHPGPSAHLEVFSPIGEHLGSADINSGTLNAQDRVRGRTLRE